MLPGEVLGGEPLTGDRVGAGIDEPDGDGGLAVANLKGFFILIYYIQSGFGHSANVRFKLSMFS